MAKKDELNFETDNKMASIVDSLVAPLSVINALVVALCMKKQKEVVNTLETLEQIWGEYQVYSKDELNQVDDTLTESSSGKSEENKVEKEYFYGNSYFSHGATQDVISSMINKPFIKGFL